MTDNRMLQILVDGQAEMRKMFVELKNEITLTRDGLKDEMKIGFEKVNKRIDRLVMIVPLEKNMISWKGESQKSKKILLLQIDNHLH